MEGGEQMKPQGSEVVLIKDKEWNAIEGEPCLVTKFINMGAYVDADGKVHADNIALPYASITFNCAKLGNKVTGFITHKVDFKNFWAAFKDRKLNEGEEIIVFWTKSQYSGMLKLFTKVLPKFHVMVCHEGAFELMNSPKLRPDLKGKDWFDAIKPIVQWKPEGIE